MFYVRSDDPWVVEKYLFAFRPGNPVLFPILQQVTLVPFKPGAFRYRIVGLHTPLYLSDIYRAPPTPGGWPGATPPPFGLTWGASSGRPSSRITASPWAANASFSSMTSIWSRRRPEAARALRVAGAGPIPMIRGGTP